MRRIKASFGELAVGGVWRAVDFEQLALQWDESLQLLVRISSDEERLKVLQLQQSGLGNVGWVRSTEVEIGDIGTPLPERGEILVFYRETDQHHSIQLTNRCNSYCLMCSQPPTRQNDDWMAEEAIGIIKHIGVSPTVLGLSGGEPLLLGGRLREILDEIRLCHPSSRVDVLTNARLLADSKLSKQLLEGLETPVTWLVPLYGHADFLHDFVVQSPGAYEETVEGLLNLQSYGQPIQLRIVLIKPVLEVLIDLCSFIGKNLPFVKEVALMACEPIGFALANRELCEVDILDWHETLHGSASELTRHGIPFLFMNMPLCALPNSLHLYAHKSISDWKNVYAPDCDECAMRSDCSGFFAWYAQGWAPSKTIRFLHKENI